MDPLFRPRTLLALITTIVLWGSAFPAVRSLLPVFPPAPLAALRYTCAAVVLVLAALIRRPPAPCWADMPRLLVIAASGIAGYNLAVNFGMRTVAAGPASFIVNTAPLFSALAAVIFLRERIRLLGWLGMIVCLGGIALIGSGGEGQHLHWSAGVAELTAAALLWAAYALIQKPLLPTYGALGVVCYAMVLGSAMLAPALPEGVACLRHASLRQMLVLAYLILGPSALAFTTWSVVVGQAPVARVMPFLYAVPLVSLSVGWLALGELPGLLALGGCVLIIAGLILVNRAGSPGPGRPGSRRPESDGPQAARAGAADRDSTAPDTGST